MFLLIAEVDQPDLVAHAQFRDHAAGDARDHRDVRARAGTDVVKHDFFGGAAAQTDLDARQQLLTRERAAVMFRLKHGDAQRLAVGHDGDLGDGIGGRRQGGDQRVSGLVPGRQTALLFVDQRRALDAQHDAIEGLVKVAHADELARGARGVQRSFIGQVGQVRAGEADGAARHLHDADVFRERFAAGVNLQDRFASLAVRPAHHDLAVEAARPQEGGVEHVGAVGGGHDDDAFVLVETVHFGQHLVERLFALVVAAAEARAAAPPDGVDLVDEDDARGVFLGLVEQVAHAAGADADEHFHELGGHQAEEGHVGFAGDRARQQGLAGAWRADQQDAARDARAQRHVLVGLLEKVDDFFQFLAGIVLAGHVAEGHLGALGIVLPRLGAAETEYAAHLPLGAARGPDEKGQQQQNGPEIEQEEQDWRRFAGARGDDDVVVAQGLRQLRVVHRQQRGGEAVRAAGRFGSDGAWRRPGYH